MLFKQERPRSNAHLCDEGLVNERKSTPCPAILAAPAVGLRPCNRGHPASLSAEARRSFYVPLIRGFAARRVGAPTQDRLAGGCGFVEAAARGQERGGVETRRIARPRGSGQCRYGHGEIVERGLALVSVGSISNAPCTTSGKYIVIG